MAGILLLSYWWSETTATQESQSDVPTLRKRFVIMTQEQEILIGTLHIVWDDTWHRIEVNGYLFTLSPTQYRVCRALLTAPSSASGTGEIMLLSYRNSYELQEETDLSRSLLQKHVSIMNARIAPSGLQLCFFQNGYGLTFSSPTKKREQERTIR